MSNDETPLSDVRFLTVAQVATIMRVSKMTVYRLVHSGELEAIRIGRSFRVPEQAVDRHLADSNRNIPVRIYLAIGDNPGLIDVAVLDLLDTYGFQVEHLGATMIGSWFREFLVRTKDSAPPARLQLSTLANAIELARLDRRRSEIDLNQAEVVARLLKALDTESDALIQIGSVLIVKANNKIIVRNLSQTELEYFNQNPALFRDPEKALQILQRYSKEYPSSTVVSG
jgi:excisionase family DNA binding protein